VFSKAIIGPLLTNGPQDRTVSLEANGFAGASSRRGGQMDRLPVIVQRTESLAVAAFVLVLGVQLGFAW